MSNKRIDLWVDQDRPTKLEDMVLPARLRKQFKDGLTGNVLFTGSPGTGKTTLAFILAQGHRTKLINASTDNGVDYIREQVINYASTASVMGGLAHKVIILDEIDHLSTNAQAALRGVIEKYSCIVRFICTCNYPEKLTDALKSRLNEVVFDYSGKEQGECCMESIKMVRNILSKYGFGITDDAIAYVFKKGYPDLRNIIITLQTITKGLEDRTEIILDDVKSVSLSTFVELYKFLLKSPKPDAIMKFCYTNFVGKEQSAISSLGSGFMNYLIEQNKNDAVGFVAVLSHKYEFESQHVTDRLRSLVALCSELSNILQNFKK